MLDLLETLGVGSDKLIMGMPTVAAKFTLADSNLTTPRSPTLNTPTYISNEEVTNMQKTSSSTFLAL